MFFLKPIHPQFAWLRGRGILLLLFFSLTNGLLCGTILVRMNELVSPDLLQFASGQTVFEQEYAWILSFFREFTSLFLLLFVPYLCGFCAIGQIGACLTMFFKGLGLGTVFANFYVQYQWQGIGYCAVVLIPPAVCVVITLFLACRESIRLANRIFSLLIHASADGIGVHMIRLYHIKFLVIAVLAVMSSLVGASFSVWFGRMFELTGS